jgi:von Willebrand factor type A domain
MGFNIGASAWRATRAAAIGVLAFAFSLLAGQDAFAVLRQTETPIDNPDLQQACGLNVLMVLDESGSIGDNDDNVRTAFKAFTAAIKNTSSSMAVAEFSKVARLPTIGPFAPGDYITVTDQTKTALDAYVDNNYNPGGNTNWEDGLRMGIANSAFAPRPTVDVPHLTVFITDGDPTRVIRNDRVTQDEYLNKVPLNDNETTDSDKNAAADRAVANANNLKTQGSHILVVAVGNGVTSAASLARIEKISGPDVFPNASNDPFDISTDDVYREPDFNELEDALREAAFQLCSPSVTVEKIVDLTPDPNSLDDALPGPNWQITGDVTAPGNGTYAWILPVGEDPGTGPKSTLTDNSGFATYQWRPADEVGPSGFAASEVIQAGFTNDQTLTSCTFRTPDSPDAPLALDTVGDGDFSITVPEESIVTCRLINIADPNPGITLEKLTDGDDADTPTGPVIPRGDVVTWTYQVANTGNTRLDNIAIDDEVTLPAAFAGQTQPGISCPKTSLIQGESMTCTATGVSGQTPGGDAFDGQYRNDATVSAVDSRGTPVSASDPSHYFEVAPGIKVEKSTNGADADQPPGSLIRVGSTVTWRYVVTNTGSEPLANVTVIDDQGVTLNFQGGDLNGNGLLDVNEIWLYVGSALAVPGQYANRAIASGEGTSETVTDEDPSHYFGLDLQVDIEKATNGEDADIAPGPILARGAAVNWTYRVRNTGNYPLDNWQVVDDEQGDINCPRVVLQPGAEVLCAEAALALEGQYRNVATVTAVSPAGGPAATDSDPSHYFGSVPALNLEKATNGEDADAPTGPFIEQGSPVNWTYVATNAGNIALRLLGVVDSRLAPADVVCPDDLLDPNESVTCTASGVAVPGQYSNLGLALAVPSGNDPNDLTGLVGDLDQSHYYGASPGIGIEKFTNGIDADTPDTATRVAIGDFVDWGYVVFNTGNAPLNNITVTDDQGVTPIYVDGDTNNNNLLDIGEQWLFEAQGVATAGLYANVGTATGSDQLGVTVSNTDPSHYFGFENAIQVEKSTNGDDADLAPGTNLAVGDAVTWEYVVTNTGASATALVRLQLEDDQLGFIVGPDSGDNNNNNELDPGETWIYTATGTAVAGQYANIATVSAVDPNGEELEDTDPSHYFGGPSAPGMLVEKFTNGDDADLAPGPLLEVGDTAVFVYLVLNTGDVPLENVNVTDDQGVAVSCAGGNPIPEIAVGATGYCFGTATAVPGQYRNVATANGTGLLGTPVSATDPSHHYGFVLSGGQLDVDIDIEKATNNVDADQPPGPLLLVGEQVNFSYVVTNLGNTPLANVSVTDDQGVAVDCPAGNPIPLMLPGETQNCTGSGTVSYDQYRNVGTALGQGPGASTAEDEDPSHHRGLTRNQLFGVPALPPLFFLFSSVTLAGIGIWGVRRLRRH